jgi:hypothetical protein
MKLAIISSRKTLWGRLCRLITGCYAFHCGWSDDKNWIFYDMSPHGGNRRSYFDQYRGYDLRFFEVDKVTRDYLEEELTTDHSPYGYLDYLLFGVRKILRLPAKNTHGKICSEKCNEDMWKCGVQTPWKPDEAPPSPCDLLEWAERNLNEVS